MITDTEQAIINAMDLDLPLGWEISKIKFNDYIRIVDMDYELPNNYPTRPNSLGTFSLVNERSWSDNQEQRDRDTVPLEGEVHEETEESDTFGWHATFSTTVTQRLSYGVSVGAGVKGQTEVAVTAEAGVEGSHTKTKRRGWNAGTSTPVPPDSEGRMKFIVTERVLNRIPWTAKLLPVGTGELELTTDRVYYEVYEHENFKGRSIRDSVKDTAKGWGDTSGIKWSYDDKGKKAKSNTSIRDRVRSMKLYGGTATMHKHHGFCHHRVDIPEGDHPKLNNHNWDHSIKFYPNTGEKKIVKLNFNRAFPNTQSGISLTGWWSNVSAIDGRFVVEEPLRRSIA